MNINYFLKQSYTNGPGKRFVLWVQGCSLHCKNCRNVDTHSFEPNLIISEKDIIKLIPEESDGLTISGGEPFDQAQDTLELCRLFKEQYPNKNIFIFTGYTLYELEDKKLTEKIMKYVDAMVIGRFVDNMQDDKSWKRWAGSSNQQLILLNNKFNKDIENKNRIEIIIGKETIVSGFPTNEDLNKYFNVKVV